MMTSTVAILHDNDGHGEDYYVVRDLDDQACLDAVMDGVTGRRGWEASEALAQALMAAPIAGPDDVLTVLADVNQRLYRRGWGRFLLTTLSAALSQHDTLHILGAGDSPVLLIRPDSAQLLSSRTSGFGPMGPMRAIGARQQLGTLYRATVALAPGDRLVLATDGVTDTIPRSDLATLVREAASPEDVVQQIQTILTTQHAAALPGSEGRRDDWTAIVRFFHA
jgi:serine/threonine protein phosphatase PrpC